MRSVLRVALVVLAMAGTAAAQPGATDPTAPPAPEPVNDHTALGISIGSTVGSWALLALAASDGAGNYRGPLAVVGALGTVLAPSFGHWYAGSRPLRGLALRVAGVAAAVGGGLFIASQCEDECSPVPGLVVLGAAAGLYLAGTIDDVVQIPGAVRRYNDGLRVNVVPAIQRGGAGVMLVGRF